MRVIQVQRVHEYPPLTTFAHTNSQDVTPNVMGSILKSKGLDIV